MKMNDQITIPPTVITFDAFGLPTMHPLLCILPQIWWSPCPSRECPDEEEQVDFVLDRCVDHCMLSRPTESPAIDPADEKDDIGVHISQKIKPPHLSNSSKYVYIF